MAVFFCMTITEAKTTPAKKVINSKSSLSCRKLDICNIIISVLFRVEENLSVGPRVLCTKCYRRIEKYKATLGKS